jgi:aerobic-type carbon monoxide dehydrogenase small subunit (CoxS/CutS family)
MKLKLRVNGDKRRVDVPPMRRLLDTLREDLTLTGTKEGCGEGECGACTVLVDGAAVNSCLVATCQVAGSDVRTIEGLAGSKRLHRLQQAFLAHGAAQCGICTPGMIMAALALPRRASLEQIREGLAGNLCRCTGYIKIYDAVAQFLGTPLVRAHKKPSKTRHAAHDGSGERTKRGKRAAKGEGGKHAAKDEGGKSAAKGEGGKRAKGGERTTRSDGGKRAGAKSRRVTEGHA